MKCQSCDKILSDREASRKSLRTGEFLDLCGDCYEEIKDEVPTKVNLSLTDEDFDDTIASPLTPKARERQDE